MDYTEEELEDAKMELFYIEKVPVILESNKKAALDEIENMKASGWSIFHVEYKDDGWGDCWTVIHATAISEDGQVFKIKWNTTNRGFLFSKN